MNETSLLLIVDASYIFSCNHTCSPIISKLIVMYEVIIKINARSVNVIHAALLTRVEQ